MNSPAITQPSANISMDEEDFVQRARALLPLARIDLELVFVFVRQLVLQLVL
jgi:hypothetical protein